MNSFKYREISEKLGKVAVDNNVYPKPLVVGSEITILSEPYKHEFNGNFYFEVAIKCSNDTAWRQYNFNALYNQQKENIKAYWLAHKTCVGASFRVVEIREITTNNSVFVRPIFELI